MALTIKAIEDWDATIAESDEKLLVIDCHQEWCGRCATLEPALTKVYLDCDQPDARISFLSASVQTHGEAIKAILPADAGLDVDAAGCRPFFLLVRFKGAVSTIVGVNSPKLVADIAMNIPDVPEADDAE